MKIIGGLSPVDRAMDRVKPLWQQKLNKGDSMEDRRAHDRIDTIQEEVKKHLAEHARFEESLKTIADNTSELVEMVRGAKGLRSFVIWAAPIAAALAAAWAWMKTP